MNPDAVAPASRRPWTISFFAVLAWVVVFNRERAWGIAGNELVYLVGLARRAHPAFLASDWTFSGPDAEHAAFDFLFMPLFRAFSLEAAAWIGRLGCWTAGIALLLKIARRLGLRPAAAAAGTILWLAFGQSMVGGEWIFGTFEAKCVAYVFLLLALDAALGESIVLAGAALGAAFTLHPSVGFWGAAAVLPALAFCRPPGRDLLFGALVAAALALPGALALAPTALASPLSARDAAFLVRIQQSFHLDPYSFEPRRLLALLLMAGWLLWRWRRRDGRAERFLFCLTVALAGGFAAGVAARALDADRFLLLFPFRLFPMLVPLFFFWRWTADAGSFAAGTRFRVAAAGLAIVLVAGDPVATLLADAASVRRMRPGPPSPLEAALGWISRHTPPDAVIVVPPMLKSAFHATRRPQVANWFAARTDRYAEWRERIEATLGPIRSRRDIQGAGVLERRYGAMSAGSIGTLERRYGARFLLTKTGYPFPLAFASGSWKVYRLDEPPPPPPRP